MAHRLTCGEKKIWQNIKKSLNIMKMIVGDLRKFGKDFASKNSHDEEKVEKSISNTI